MPPQHPSTISQSYVTQTLPQSKSMTTPHDHSVHNIPDNTTLPMLNPWQKQSNFEQRKLPQAKFKSRSGCKIKAPDRLTY